MVGSRHLNIQHRFEPLDDETFRTVQQSIISYIQSEYVYGPAESTATCASFLALRSLV